MQESGPFSKVLRCGNPYSTSYRISALSDTFLAPSSKKLFIEDPLQYQQQIKMGRAWDTEEEAVLLYFTSSGMPYDAVGKAIKLKCGINRTQKSCRDHIKSQAR